MKEVLQFLTELKENNNKEWFDLNRKRYEAAKKKVLFLSEFVNHEIVKFDSEVGMLNPKDCLFRIFRDVRFSNEKTPYKTNMGSFIASGGRKSIYAGYYIHIEPGASFIGGGSYCPQPDALKALRTEIYDNAEEFKSIIFKESFVSCFPEMYDDKLKTAPKGFPKDFPEIDLLKYKSYAFTSKISDELILSENFVNTIIECFRELHPANQFLNQAIKKWL